MGTVSEMLNTLGYGEYVPANVIQVANSNGSDDSPSTTDNHDCPTTPKGHVANGSCFGCELSARYF